MNPGPHFCHSACYESHATAEDRSNDLLEQGICPEPGGNDTDGNGNTAHNIALDFIGQCPYCGAEEEPVQS